MTRRPSRPDGGTGSDRPANDTGGGGAADLEARFAAAQVRVKQLTRAPAVDELLELYALFKQATAGDAPADRPSAFDFKAAAKHDAWAQHRGTDRGAAMKAYVDLVGKLTVRYG